MKAAIGQSILSSIIFSFVTVVLLILISSIVYTKAFRIKNRIVDVIEKYEEYDSDNAKNEINQMLSEIGYIANNYSNNYECNKYSEKGELQNSTSAFHYCVFKLEHEKGNGYYSYYYKVVTFAYLDIPLINAIQIPVYGETKLFYARGD